MNGLNNLPSLKDNKTNTLSGWMFILFPLIFLLFFIWLPIIQAFIMSFQKINLLRGAELIGLKNYVRMFSDNLFWKSVLNSFRITIFSPNIFYFIIAPLAIALLLMKAGKGIEITGRLITGLFIFCSASVLISSIYRWYLSQAGMGGLLQSAPVLTNPDTAIIALQSAQLVYGIGISVPLGLVLYMACLKGALFSFPDRPSHKNIWSNIWRCSLLLFITVFAFSVQSFTAGWVITQDGPAHSTMVIISRIFRESFQMFKFGAGAANQMILICILMLCGLALWLLLEKSGIKIWLGRITNSTDTDTGKKLKGTGYTVIAVASAIIICALLVVTVIWILVPGVSALSTSFSKFGTNAFTLENYSMVLKETGFVTGFVNSFLVFFFSLIFQTGISLTGGYALGRYRFGGHQIVFFLVCFTAFISPHVISPQLFLNFKNLGMLNNIIAVMLPYFGWPIGIILFKLYFEGVQIECAVIQNLEDQAERNIRKKRITINTVYMIIFVIVLFFIIKLNELFLPLTLLSKESTYTLNMMLLVITGKFVTEYGVLLASVFISFIPVFIMGGIFLFLQIVFFPNMKIIRTIALE